MKTRKTLLEDFGEDTGPGLKFVEDRREDSGQVCTGLGLVWVGPASLPAMGPTLLSSLTSDAPTRSSPPHAQFCVRHLKELYYF